MAASYVFLALAAVFCYAQSANVPESPDIQGLVKELQVSLEKSVDEIKKNLNLPENPDGASIVKALREQTDKAAKTLKDMKGKLDESIKQNPELSDAIKGLQAKIEEGRNKLKQENPEAAKNAEKIADSMKQAYESVGKEIEKLHAEVNKKGGLRDDLDNLLKNLIDRGNAAAKEWSVKVQEVIKEVTDKKPK